MNGRTARVLSAIHQLRMYHFVLFHPLFATCPTRLPWRPSLPKPAAIAPGRSVRSGASRYCPPAASYHIDLNSPKL